MKNSAINKIFWNRIFIVIYLIFFNQKTGAQTQISCPAWIINKESTQTCPEYQLIPDTYPVMAIVFPGKPKRDGWSNYSQKDFTKEFGFQLLTTISPTMNSGHLPILVLPFDAISELKVTTQ
ncbi:MAG: hypothetical protein QE271_14540 [Bacteriovoracaceae bacterium]|nr:hypothetical protein [Bacteriovoracaceae bacterium]